MISSAALSSATFAATRFREGYDMSDVDAFLAKAVTALRVYESRSGAAVGLTADQVVGVRFQPTKFRAGYDQTQVDDFLDQIVAAFREYEAQRPTIL